MEDCEDYENMKIYEDVDFSIFKIKRIAFLSVCSEKNFTLKRSSLLWEELISTLKKVYLDRDNDLNNLIVITIQIIGEKETVNIFSPNDVARFVVYIREVDGKKLAGIREFISEAHIRKIS